MSAWKDHWPLSRRWAFLRPRLLRLRQKSHVFQVDFCPLPNIVENEHGFWLGLVVDPGLDLVLATSILDEPPIVQDLAEILSDAMECPLPCGCFRPEIVLLRDNPKWDQLSLTMHWRCLCEPLYYRTEVIQTDASFTFFFLQAVASSSATSRER